jgi:hypothetical protein
MTLRKIGIQDENVGYNGMPTDWGMLISAIGAGSNGITE